MLRVIIAVAVLGVVRTAPQSAIDCEALKKVYPETKCNDGTTVAPVTKPPTKPEDYAKCTTKNGTAGFCVPYYLCKSGEIIKDGRGLIDIRSNHDECKSYLDRCCILPDIKGPNDPITPPPDTKPKHEGCGWRNPEGVGFYTTGDKDGESKFGEFPWMVAIFNADYINPRSDTVNVEKRKGKKPTAYLGGGSLIHPSAVLTAAHYVASVPTLKVRAGEWDTQTTKEIYPYQERDVSSKIVHQEFDEGDLYYDIAVLFLVSPMELAPHVGVACLPPPGERAPGGVRCLASGWGKDKFGQEGLYQVILKKVELPVVTHHHCQTALRNTRLGHFYELHTSFMCAGGEPDKDTCTGDGGSPLVCPIEHQKDRYMQSGIVAWGIGCGGDGTPGVYVDVSHLRKWVDNVIISKGLDPKVYTF